jgi:hypothetical protein
MTARRGQGHLACAGVPGDDLRSARVVGQAADPGAGRDVPRGGGPGPLDGGGSAKVGTLLREAIEKVNKGEYGDAVTAVRRAVDAMGGGWASEKGIVSAGRAQRSLDQRLFWPGVPADCAGRPCCP